MTDVLRELLQETRRATCAIEREPGVRGMSRVFVADDEALERNVVVKIVTPELAEGVSVERFTLEVRPAAR